MRPLAWRAVGVGAIAAAVAVLIALGVVGIGRGGDRFVDGRFFCEAGRVWLDGRNPYLPENATTEAMASCPFAYPPQVSLPCMALGLVGREPAGYILTGANLLAAGALAWLTFVLARRWGSEAGRSVSPHAWWFLPAVVVGNPFTAHNVWMGQTTLIGAALVVGGWASATGGRVVLAGILLGAATFKPPIVMLPLLWMLLERRWRVLLVAGATSLLLAAYPLILDGPVETTRTWLGAVNGYKSIDVNTPGFRHVLGVPSFLAALGIGVPDLTLAGIALAAALWWRRDRVHHADVLGILLALYLGVVFGHDYDAVMLAPAAAAISVYAARSRGVMVAGCAAIVLLCIPQRFVRGGEIGVIQHWRTPVVLLIVAGLVAMSVAERRRLRRGELFRLRGLKMGEETGEEKQAAGVGGASA